MKLDISKETLLAKVQLVGRVSGKQVTLPVLQGILMEAKEGRLWLRATNLDIGIEASVGAKIEQEGVCVVVGNVLTQVLSSLVKGGTVSLELVEGALTLKGSHGTTKLTTLDHTEFPSLPRVEDGEKIILQARDVISGMKSVWFAASHSSIKPELASVYIYEENGSLVCVATDSFRLAEKKVRMKKPSVITPLLIPNRTVVDVIRTLEMCDGEVELAFSQNQLSCSFDDVYMTTRLVNGTFPDYRQIIPKEQVTTVVFLKQDILSALKKATIFSDRFNQVTFTVESHKKKITLEAHSAEIGEMNDTIDGVIEGDDISISFNQRYVIDAFQSIESDSVSFRFSGAGRPVIITGVGDESFLYLVMPMNK